MGSAAVTAEMVPQVATARAQATEAMGLQVELVVSQSWHLPTLLCFIWSDATHGKELPVKVVLLVVRALGALEDLPDLGGLGALGAAVDPVMTAIRLEVGEARVRQVLRAVPVHEGVMEPLVALGWLPQKLKTENCLHLG